MPLTPEIWLDEFTANTTTTNFQYDQHIIQLANGNILVSWTTNDNTGAGSSNGLDVVGQIFDPLGNPVGSEFQLNASFFVDDESRLEMAALPGGGFVVAYVDDDSSTFSIRLDEFDATGAAVAASYTVIDDSSSGTYPNYTNPTISVSSATSVLITYESELASGDIEIKGKIYDTTTNSYSSEIAILGFTGENTQSDSTVLSNGNYVIVARDDGADARITMRILDDAGANVLAATEVAATGSNGDGDANPTVTALTGGGFVVAWENTDSDTDIQAMVFDSAGTAVSGTISVETGGATDNDNEPVIAALGDGGFVVIYDDDESGQIGLKVEHYNASGVLQGSNFVITSANVAEPDAVLLEDGRVAVTWNTTGFFSNIQMAILDTRDAENSPAVYDVSDEWQIGTVGDDTFTADFGTENVHGWDGDDTITDAGGIEHIYGDDGDDTINVTSTIGSDSFDGGDGVDTIDWSGSGQTNATFDLAAGTATDGIDTEIMTNFENLTGTNNADTINGTNGDNSLKGGGGDDAINGYNGNDSIDGGDGNDVISAAAGNDGIVGGLGNDIIYTGEGDDIAYGGDGDDRIIGGSGVDSLSGDAGNDLLDGLDGNDTLEGGAGNDTLAGGNGDDILNGGDGIDTISGGNGDDTINGGAGDDALYGGNGVDMINGQDGADSIVAAAGDDIITGGIGDDLIYAGAGANTVSGGADNDTILGGELGDTLNGDAGNDSIYAQAGNDTINGGDGNDGLSGQDGNDTLNGEAGVDTLSGGAGSDILDGGTGNDLLYAGTGNDSLIGGAGDDVLFAGDGLDLLSGGDGNDRLYGQAGTNNLYGGAGDDNYYGGSGVDTYQFDAADGVATERVSGFQSTDIVQLNGFGFANAGAAYSSFTQSGANVVFNSGGVTIVFYGADLAFVQGAVQVDGLAELPTVDKQIVSEMPDLPQDAIADFLDTASVFADADVKIDDGFDGYLSATDLIDGHGFDLM